MTAPNAPADWKEQLAGLMLPPEPSAWPPAPAAVLLALLMAGLCVLAVTLAWRRRRANAWKRQALRELSALTDTPDARALSRLLRRVARERFPAPNAALTDGSFAELIEATTNDRIPNDLALELASCAHRADVQLDQRHLRAAREWISAC